MTNYRMPAEWEPHEATWLTWPTNISTWPGKMLKEVESIYLQMMQALLSGEKVHLLVPDEKTAQKVSSLLQSKKAAVQNLVPHRVKTVDTWIRDYGPIFVKRSNCHSESAAGGRRIYATQRSLPVRQAGFGANAPQDDVSFCKFTFNAWGGKYRNLALDNGVVDRIDYFKKFKRTTIPMVFEGGSIDMNGRGSCLTTEQCLLNKNRNPKLSKKNIENNIKKYLGVRQIIWLKEGIEGDDTDGHVDDITRFVAPDTILTAVENDTRDINHGILKENLRILRASCDLNGKKFKIVEFPMPGPVGVKKGRSSLGRFPASYANFYIANKAILLPVYSHRNDREAARILRKLFPGRKVVPIECTALVHGLGSIHCVTQQQPR